MSMSTDICTAPFLGATREPRLNEWEVFTSEFAVDVLESYNWMVAFQPSATGDVYYDAFRVVELPRPGLTGPQLQAWGQPCPPSGA